MFNNDSSQSNFFSIITYGCTFNHGDSLKIENILSENGYHKRELADSKFVIINTCAVKHTTEAKILFFIEKLVNLYPHKIFIITGCLPQIEKKMSEKINRIIQPNGFILHPHDIGDILNIFKKCRNETGLITENKNNRDKSVLLPKSNLKSKIGIIQISEGCNNQCSYCCTTNARGSLVSFNFENLINQFQTLLSQGIIEYHLTSQDLGNYNNKGKLLHELLRKISEIKGNFKIRLGMLNPDYLINNITEFMKIFNDQRFYRFLHLPIQSASNNVLKTMKRNYKIEEVDKIIRVIRNYDENFTFGTDIIVGFPTESSEDFLKTLTYIEKWRPHVLNISKFTPRPKTEAKNMNQLKSQVIKNRSQKISLIYLNYSKDNNQKWINWKGEIFINEYKKNVDYPFTGRNIYYIPILCKTGELGQLKSVSIKKYINHSLIGG
jgi:threonylcarbamoyladenosine tRNA methylthiotransferase CDKAL1